MPASARFPRRPTPPPQIPPRLEPGWRDTKQGAAVCSLARHTASQRLFRSCPRSTCASSKLTMHSMTTKRRCDRPHSSPIPSPYTVALPTTLWLPGLVAAVCGVPGPAVPAAPPLLADACMYLACCSRLTGSTNRWASAVSAAASRARGDRAAPTGAGLMDGVAAAARFGPAAAAVLLGWATALPCSCSCSSRFASSLLRCCCGARAARRLRVREAGNATAQSNK